jgi:predicted DNA repair protein MutK
MAGGLVALLDDIAALVKLAAASVDDVGAAAAKASVKATGVVVDDTAVTPRYVEGLAPERELPIIRKIALGSLRNKLLIILPVIMVLSQFVPWALTPILMVGGAYLAYEGAEKVWEILSGHREEKAEAGEVDEDAVVSGAIRTDFILSAEIMVIALNEVDTEPFVSRLIILVIVALLITALVYGVVGLIVKMDDVGLHLAGRRTRPVQALGRTLVRAMPVLLAVISTVGVAAMLWVGGHILLVGVDELGWHALYDLVHHLEEDVAGVAGIGGLLAWVVNTLASALIGLVVGAIIVAVLHVIPRRRKHDGAAAAH